MNRSVGGMDGFKRVFDDGQAVGTVTGVCTEPSGIYISAASFALVDMVGFTARSFGTSNDDAV